MCTVRIADLPLADFNFECAEVIWMGTINRVKSRLFTDRHLMYCIIIYCTLDCTCTYCKKNIKDADMDKFVAINSTLLPKGDTCTCIQKLWRLANVSPYYASERVNCAVVNMCNLHGVD